MLYFIENTAGELVAVTNDLTVNTAAPRTGARKLCRWDFKTFADAEAMAVRANALHGGRLVYIPTDAGSSVSPRYDVQEAPKVGDMVSRGFNGDYYPAGQIVKISKSLKRIETDTGKVFFRVRQTGSWRNDGTWSMVQGHRKELNPSF